MAVSGSTGVLALFGLGTAKPISDRTARDYQSSVCIRPPLPWHQSYKADILSRRVGSTRGTRPTPAKTIAAAPARQPAVPRPLAAMRARLHELKAELKAALEVSRFAEVERLAAQAGA